MNKDLFYKIMTAGEKDKKHKLLDKVDKKELEMLNSVIFRRALNPQVGKEVIGIKKAQIHDLGCDDSVIVHFSRTKNYIPEEITIGNWIPVHLIEELSELLTAITMGLDDTMAFKKKDANFPYHYCNIIEELADVIIHINYFNTILSMSKPYQVTDNFFTIDLDTDFKIAYNGDNNEEFSTKDLKEIIFYISDLIKKLTKFVWKYDNYDEFADTFRKFNEKVIIKLIKCLSISSDYMEKAITIKHNRGINLILHGDEECESKEEEDNEENLQ